LRLPWKSSRFQGFYAADSAGADRMASNPFFFFFCSLVIVVSEGSPVPSYYSPQEAGLQAAGHPAECEAANHEDEGGGEVRFPPPPNAVDHHLGPHSSLAFENAGKWR